MIRYARKDDVQRGEILLHVTYDKYQNTTSTTVYECHGNFEYLTNHYALISGTGRVLVIDVLNMTCDKNSRLIPLSIISKEDIFEAKIKGEWAEVIKAYEQLWPED